MIANFVRKPFERDIPLKEFEQNPVEDEVRLSRDINGNCVYTVLKEKKDVAQYINSFANGCSLKAILDRCSLMPVVDKVRYLQQTVDGYSADVADLPTDLTSAIITLHNSEREHKEIFDRFRNGESFDSIVKDLFAPKENTDNKEEITNG